MTSERVASEASASDSISDRAAKFLAVNYIGPHKDKRIARLFGVSLGMAKLLRAGKCWTVARLDQAIRLYGRGFGDFVFPPTADEIHDKLDRLNEQLAALRETLRGKE